MSGDYGSSNFAIFETAACQRCSLTCAQSQRSTIVCRGEGCRAFWLAQLLAQVSTVKNGAPLARISQCTLADSHAILWQSCPYSRRL